MSSLYSRGLLLQITNTSDNYLTRGEPLMKTRFILLCAAVGGASAVFLTAASELTPVEQLGKELFFDTNLSTPPGQSCATCHDPTTGFTSPDPEINEAGAVYHGVIEKRFGNRKLPTVAYAGDSPVLQFDEDEGLWIGGMFWDGRATGWTLGDPLAEQALGPFLNNLEQNMPSAKQVIRRVAKSRYARLFELVWGPGSLDDKKDVAGTYERIGRAIAAYERSSEINPFSSKYDFWLKGEVALTEEERWGLELFEGKGMCSACHPSRPENGKPPLFTDFSYDNLGLPRNPENPFYSAPRSINRDRDEWVDPGLAGFLASEGYPPEVWMPELGKHKVPTLRNVDQRPWPEFVKAYGHNGVFKSLKGIVHFYNTRDVKSWPSPEVSENVNDEELGDLRLTDEEEDAIVTFLKTLTDGYGF
jgi:cytochrome c peroxidase